MSNIETLRATLKEHAVFADDRPKGMPGAFYTSKEFFEFEKQTVLKNGWHCLGRVDEVANQGDYFTVQLLDEPLLIVRGDDDTIRVLSNLCRHRSMPLAEGSGNAKRFVCSYHAWTYARDGALMRATRMKNAGFDAKTCRLPEFPCTIWRGFIYSTLADEPLDFTATASSLDAQIADYEPENFQLVHTAEENWRTNWKCLVENFMEGYHLSVVHPATLHGYTPTGLAKKGASGEGFTSYFANYPDGTPSRGAGAPGLDDAARNRSTLFSIFPAQVASQAASLLVSLMIFPLAADLIRVKWTMSVYGDNLDGDTIEARIGLWDEVNREDREKLEWLQTTLSSKHAVAGPLASDDYEGTIKDFHRWMASSDAG